MKTVFADTNYWVAIINPLDQLHDRAVEVEKSIRPVAMVTTEPVFVEVLNYFCSFGPAVRDSACRVVRRLMMAPGVELVQSVPEMFLRGLALYEARRDKAYSLTDCISMNLMRDRGLADVLTQDRHFTQEGFNTLL